MKFLLEIVKKYIFKGEDRQQEEALMRSGLLNH